MFRSIQTKTMFFMASLAICLIVIIGYMTVFAMDYAIDEIKENDMRDKAIMAANVVSRELGRNSQPTAEILAALDKDSLNGDIFLINSRGYSIGNRDTEKPYDFGISGKCSVQEIYKNNKYYVSALAPVKGTNWYECAEET